MFGAKPLEEGSMLPDVTLVDKAGKNVKLRDWVGKGPLVVYFYPKDDTPGCTAEACSFRDQYEDFVGAGAEVIGISADGQGSHEQFSSKYKLPFVLLSDKDGSARKAFRVENVLGILPRRVTFVADAKGKIRHVFESQVRAGAHVDRALEIVRGLSGKDGGVSMM